MRVERTKPMLSMVMEGFAKGYVVSGSAKAGKTKQLLDGRAALVTGAGSRGIGQAIAMAFAEAGADVALHYLRSSEGAQAASDAIRALGRDSLVVQADLSDCTHARSAIGQVVEHFGQLDILVNNAATVSRKPFLEVSDDDWDTVLNTNLRGYFVCSQAAARSMADRGNGGRIIMVSSVNQQIVTRNLAPYCASKGGVMQLAKAMAVELAPMGITVNLLAPGTVETDLNRDLLAEPEFRKRRLEPVPLGRLGTPEDLRDAALFLAGPGSSYVTGATIVIDGGLTLTGLT